MRILFKNPLNSVNKFAPQFLQQYSNTLTSNRHTDLLRLPESLIHGSTGTKPASHDIAQYKATQSALEFCPIHCPNGRLGQDLGFGGSAFALKLPELLNRNLVAVRAKLGQTSCFPN